MRYIILKSDLVVSTSPLLHLPTNISLLRKLLIVRSTKKLVLQTSVFGHFSHCNRNLIFAVKSTLPNSTRPPFKIFIAVVPDKLECLYSCKAFQLSLMYAGKAKILLFKGLHLGRLWPHSQTSG